MTKKNIGVTLVELVVAVVVGAIIISVASASIIAVLKFFYDLSGPSGRMSQTQKDWVVANSTLAECVRDSSYYTIANNGTTLNLFPYTDQPGTPTATWVFANTPAGLTLTRTGRPTQTFENVAVTFTNPNSTLLPNQQLRVNFTRPFTASFFYTCGRNSLPYEGAIIIPANEGNWHNPRLFGPVIVGNHIVQFGLNHDASNNALGVIAIYNRWNGNQERKFSYQWVRGETSDLGFYYWDQPMINSTDYAGYSYVGGMVRNPGSQDMMPVLAKVDIRADTDAALAASTGNITFAKAIDIQDMSPGGSDEKTTCYISDVKETNPGNPNTTLFCAGQAFISGSTINDNNPTSYALLLKNVDLVNAWTPNTSNTIFLGPNSVSSIPRRSGLGNRGSAWPYVPKLCRLGSLTSNDYFMIHNSNFSIDGATNGSTTSNIGLFRSNNDNVVAGNDNMNWAQLYGAGPFVIEFNGHYYVVTPYITGVNDLGFYVFGFGSITVSRNISYNLSNFSGTDGLSVVPENYNLASENATITTTILASIEDPDNPSRNDLRRFYGVDNAGNVLADGITQQSSTNAAGAKTLSSLQSAGGYITERLNPANGLGNTYQICTTMWDRATLTVAGYSTTPPLGPAGNGGSVDMGAGFASSCPKNFGAVCLDTQQGPGLANPAGAPGHIDATESTIVVQPPEIA